MGYKMKPAHNRKGVVRAVPCPMEKVKDIMEALEKA
jgi:hypothetical protein